MKLSIQTLFAPILAVLMLVLVLNVTLGALRDSGAWQRRKAAPTMMPTNPYAVLDHVIAGRSARLPESGIRNPFTMGAAPITVTVTRTTRRTGPPPPPPRPVLTSIVWDNDPRATLRWNGRDYAVRPNGLFDNYRVVSITRDEVVLERGGESFTLRMVAR